MKFFVELNEKENIQNIEVEDFNIGAYYESMGWKKIEIEISQISYLLKRDFSGGLSFERRQELINSSSIEVSYDLYEKGIIRKEKGKRLYGGAYDTYSIDSDSFRINGKKVEYAPKIIEKIIELYDAQ